ncbi:MAG: DNA replication/repair protein RecF [Beijerinckiaceae bacterium]
MSRVQRLILSDFRNYPSLDLKVESGMVALVGENGAGKTNILEALSLFAPGRGMRRAEFSSISRQAGQGSFAVSVEMDGALGLAQLGVGYNPAEENGRRCRINREPVGSATAFSDHCRLIWLMPDHDGLFRASAGERRRFLDRLVLAIDSDHGTRVSALEKALRSRNRLLEGDRPDPLWLDAIEKELAEVAMAVVAARRETVQRLAALVLDEKDPESPFPYAVLNLQGDLETALDNASALAVEEWYRQSLKNNRWRDKGAGRTLIGPHASDLVVRHGPKDMPAVLSSTGEQKALLVGLILAHAKLVSQMSGIAPLILLDEIAAHLDPARRSALYKRLADCGGQVWMTGTDFALFDQLPKDAVCLSVAKNHIS